MLQDQLTKIQHHIPVLLVNAVLLRAVVVKDLKLVQQQQIERVQLVLQDQLIKIQHHIPVHRAKLVVLRVVAVLNLLLVHRQEQQIERVLVVNRGHTKIPIYIPVQRA